MNMRWTGVMAIGLLIACSTEPTETKPASDTSVDTSADTSADTAADTRPEPDAGTDTESDAPTDVEADVLSDALVDAVEDTGPPPPPPTRPRRRMDLDQLEASLAEATGTLGWVRANGTSRFEELRATLGVPDYIRRTAEDLTASVVFQKFLSDAARAVCTTSVRAESELVDPAERVLLRYVELTDTLASNESAIRENLAYLLLRFHGLSIEPDDPQIQPWVDLVAAVQAETEEPVQAWRTVCVGLSLHPAFLSY